MRRAAGPVEFSGSLLEISRPPSASPSMTASTLTLRVANRPASRCTPTSCAAAARRGIRRAAQSLTLLVGGFFLLGTTEAQATCGDWLAHPVAGHEAAVATQGRQETPPSAAMTSVDATPPPAERRSPCQGPGCRSLPEYPVSPPPPPSSPSDDQQACTGRIIDLSSPLSGVFCRGSNAAPRAGFYPRLEDPPRRLPGIGA